MLRCADVPLDGRRCRVPRRLRSLVSTGHKTISSRSASLARSLVSMVLSEYRLQHPNDPAELFIHAKSSFSDEEWGGFIEASEGTGTNVVGVQIADACGNDNSNFFVQVSYPTIRGTAMLTSKRSAFLWTQGSCRGLRLYGAETPESPSSFSAEGRRSTSDKHTAVYSH